MIESIDQVLTAVVVGRFVDVTVVGCPCSVSGNADRSRGLEEHCNSRMQFVHGGGCEIENAGADALARDVSAGSCFGIAPTAQLRLTFLRSTKKLITPGMMCRPELEIINIARTKYTTKTKAR